MISDKTLWYLRMWRTVQGTSTRKSRHEPWNSLDHERASSALFQPDLFKVSNIFRENWIRSESEHLNIDYDILCYPNRLMSLKCFNKKHITLAFCESRANLVECHNRGTAGFVREVVLEKGLT